MAPKTIGQVKDRVKVMEDADRDKYLNELRKNYLKEKSTIEQKHSKYNSSKIQESWLKIMRSAKTKQLKREVEIIAQSHERDMDRKDAIMQMLDRDLDEAEEQHQFAIRTHLLNMETLMEIQDSRVEELREDFRKQVEAIDGDWAGEREELVQSAEKRKRELRHLVLEVIQEEKNKEQIDLTEHQASYELIRNKNIEEDHQMRSHLEEKIEAMKDKCNAALNTYRISTEQNTQDYKTFLARDATLSKHVEKKLRQVERMQANIVHWKQKILQNRQECEERNAHLRSEKEHLLKHFQELKVKMTKFRDEQHKRLTELTVNAETCLGKLKENLGIGEGILKLAEACRRYETEREKVLPFYENTGLKDMDVDSLPNEVLQQYIADFQTRLAAEKSNEILKLEKQKKELFDHIGSGEMVPNEVQIQASPEEEEDQYAMIKEDMKEVLFDGNARDEWSYLDNFFKRFNKVHLDVLAIKKEKQRLRSENLQLRSILKQFLDGVAVSEEVLQKPNPLFVVNGRVNLNYVPPKKDGGKSSKVVVEAHTTVKQMATMRG
mmetsp:Transcript_28244/g.71697  ORF Transcript_28244/g.71697 Transcript_28244/m.71697 type:complete len:550 (-) Transcript_28244:420-2069(-)|eukprot:CAMPEP_0179009524 /NCGR_PEP_ID=MMETSP0795-20121207/16318_1 /TAXON_ID=88552 /ORGANISM="Amoebophrya sp., Strain Ameob2" /LENGTH=549 /DNA_ID=CAMNT_0020704727 /DNA_START=558 /DNA_END=2207 /DNA_ORIENTATION=+